MLAETVEEYEIILVNDGSNDGSWDQVQVLASLYPEVFGINLTRNFGQHNALLCGIRAARLDICVTLDDDLQNPPEAIPDLIAALAFGGDLVYGVPTREHQGFLKSLSSKLTKASLGIVAGGVIDAKSISPFRLFHTSLRESFASFDSPFVSIDVLLSWGARDSRAVPVAFNDRTIGKSGYSFTALVRHAFNMVTGFSIAPLRLVTVIGFVFSAVGFFVLAYTLIAYALSPSTVPGFPFLASIIAMFAGVQLFALGVIGEYIGRQYFLVLGRPSYSVAETTNLSRDVRVSTRTGERI